MAEKKEIFIFGDSIVWGVFDFIKGGWPRRLEEYLKTNVTGIKVNRYGIIGNDTRRLLKEFEMKTGNSKPDIIIFAIGINDSQIINSQSRIPLEEFQSNLNQLIEKAKRYTQQVVFIGLSRVDDIKAQLVWWSRKGSYLNEVINKYDSALKSVIEEKDCFYVEVADIFVDKSLLSDGVHPNSKGHQKLFEKVKNYLHQKSGTCLDETGN